MLLSIKMEKYLVEDPKTAKVWEHNTWVPSDTFEGTILSLREPFTLCSSQMKRSEELMECKLSSKAISSDK